jgi:hypothetical protein
VLSKFIDIHALKLPRFAYLLTIHNKTCHLRLGNYGTNCRRQLIKLNRFLADSLKLTDDRLDRYRSTGLRIRSVAFLQFLHTSGDDTICHHHQPTSVPSRGFGL